MSNDISPSPWRTIGTSNCYPPMLSALACSPLVRPNNASFLAAGQATIKKTSAGVPKKPEAESFR